MILESETETRGNTFEFSLGEIKSERFGTAHLKGTLQLLGKYQEPNLVNLEKAGKILETEVKKLRIPCEDVAEFSNLKVALLSSAYFNPESDIEEPAMIGTSLFFLSVILIDDVLDRTGGFGGIGVSGEFAKQFLQETLKALQGEYITLDKIPPTIPSLDPVVQLGFLSHAYLSRGIPEFATKSVHLRKELREDALAGLLMKEEGFGDVYSNETYKLLRARVGGLYSVIELILLIRGVTLAPEIRESLVFKILLANAAGACSLTNDTLGLRKEIKNEEFDNLVLRLTDNEGIPLGHAFNAVNDLIMQQRKDVVLACEKLEEEFPEDDSVSRFNEAIKTLLDGHIYFSIYGKRYGDIDVNFL